MLLSGRLREIGYTPEVVRTTSARHAALRDDPAALALRLFRDQSALNVEEAAFLLGGASCPTLEQEGALICSPYRLDPVGNLYLFSDWPGAELDEVLPAGETTAILFRAARATGDAHTALDLGCGSGTLALLLAQHADHVIGTDINPRAIRLAEINAGINAIGNVEFRLGSLYQPVAQESFDLIVSQPPYIPLPSGAARHLFLNAGERGDELARAIIAGLAGHLTARGRALVFSDWPLAPGESLQGCIPRTGLRTVLYASPPLTIESYADSYGAELTRHFSQMGFAGIRQCLAYFEPGDGVTECEVLPHQWMTLPPLSGQA